MTTRFVFLMALILGSLMGCGPGSTPPPAAATKAAVIVTLDGEHHVCVIAKSGEPTGSTVGCADALSFVRDELRIAAGATYDVHSVPPVDAAELSKVKDALNGAGYRFVGTSDAAGNP